MKWISIENDLPKYAVQISGIKFVSVILADKDGGVWPGDYTEGKFMVLGIHQPHITHWMYFPEHPNSFLLDKQ